MKTALDLMQKNVELERENVRLREALLVIQFESLEILDGFVEDSDVERLMNIAADAIQED